MPKPIRYFVYVQDIQKNDLATADTLKPSKKNIGIFFILVSYEYVRKPKAAAYAHL
jgi:hypothetical protein